MPSALTLPEGSHSLCVSPRPGSHCCPVGTFPHARGLLSTTFPSTEAVSPNLVKHFLFFNLKSSEFYHYSGHLKFMGSSN